MGIALELQNVTKVYKNRSVVDQVTMSVEQGQVFGFLGPNGAGKTTTIRMIVGLIHPTQGEIRIFGHDIKTEFTKAIQHVGAIVENPEMYKFMTGHQNLVQFSRMAGDIPPKRIDEVVEFVGLKDRIHDKVKTYSLGMRQRLGIAQALLNRPRLLILDEPTNGLDPAGMKEIRELVRYLADTEAMTVFVSSHLLHEVEMMCDSVAIVQKGKVMAHGLVSELLKQENTIKLRVSESSRARSIIEAQDYVKQSIAKDNGDIQVQIDELYVPTLNRILVQNGINVHRIEGSRISLEEVFMDITGGESIA